MKVMDGDREVDQERYDDVIDQRNEADARVEVLRAQVETLTRERDEYVLKYDRWRVAAVATEKRAEKAERERDEERELVRLGRAAVVALELQARSATERAEKAERDLVETTRRLDHSEIRASANLERALAAESQVKALREMLSSWRGAASIRERNAEEALQDDMRGYQRGYATALRALAIDVSTLLNVKPALASEAAPEWCEAERKDGPCVGADCVACSEGVSASEAARERVANLLQTLTAERGNLAEVVAELDGVRAFGKALRELVREAEFALSWAQDHSDSAKVETILEAKDWCARARAALTSEAAPGAPWLGELHRAALALIDHVEAGKLAKLVCDHLVAAAPEAAGTGEAKP